MTPKEISVATGLPESVPLSDHRKNALLGMGIFIHASLKNPLSVSAQAARIAEYCRRHNLNPMSVSDALLNDDDAISRTLAKANNVHTSRNRNVVLNAERVREIINSDFFWADKMAKLTDIDLQEIYGRTYKENSYPGGVEEDRIKRKVKILMKKRKVERRGKARSRIAQAALIRELF